MFHSGDALWWIDVRVKPFFFPQLEQDLSGVHQTSRLLKAIAHWITEKMTTTDILLTNYWHTDFNETTNSRCEFYYFSIKCMDTKQWTHWTQVSLGFFAWHQSISFLFPHFNTFDQNDIMLIVRINRMLAMEPIVPVISNDYPKSIMKIRRK